MSANLSLRLCLFFLLPQGNKHHEEMDIPSHTGKDIFMIPKFELYAKSVVIDVRGNKRIDSTEILRIAFQPTSHIITLDEES